MSGASSCRHVTVSGLISLNYKHDGGKKMHQGDDLMKAYWESDGHMHHDDARAVYVIVPDGMFGHRIECPYEIWGNAARRRWAIEKVAELNKHGDGIQ